MPAAASTMAVYAARTATAIGPLVAGYIYDLSQSYQLAFILGALTNFLALILVFISRPPQKKVGSQELGSISME